MSFFSLKRVWPLILVLQQFMETGNSQALEPLSSDRTCPSGACRDSLQAYLVNVSDSMLLDPALGSSCSSPMRMYSILVRDCAADLVKDFSQGCMCSTHCAKSIQAVPKPCLAALVSFFCGTIPDAYKQGVDLFSGLEMLMQACYPRPGGAFLPSPLCPSVTPKDIRNDTDCSTLSTAPGRTVRQPNFARADPLNAFDTTVTPPRDDLVADQSFVGDDSFQGASGDAHPGYRAPVCGTAACRDGLLDWLESNFHRFYVVTECGDLSVLLKLWTEDCAEELAETGPDCRCSSRCSQAMQALPLSCLAQAQNVVCMSALDARAQRVELAEAMSDLLGRCHAAEHSGAAAMEIRCSSVPQFSPVAVCGSSTVSE